MGKLYINEIRGIFKNLFNIINNMCGITGVLFFNNDYVDKDLLKQMNNTISYRGPDGEGYFIDKNIGLGHRRLAIIDLSENGKQPMSNEDESIWIVFNGEIYNFQELRKQLEEKKHIFKSNTDTEIIIHLYEEYGEKCLGFLRGMFAFAIWDSNKKQLFLARDRFGKKPLVYYIDNERIIFASEIKAIIEDSSVKRIIDNNALSHYLSFGYIPAPLSIFNNIKKLLPAHYMIIENTGNIIIKKYWDVKFNETNFSEEYYSKKILELIDESTRIRMISDVPLGAFLSGGIDSSTVVAMMSKNSNIPIKTFSIGSEEESYNELKYARIIAEEFNTEHKEFVVKPNAIDILPKLVWYYNEPYSDSSALPSYYLAKLTKRYVTVALNGDGGDENFGGYDRYAIEKAMNIYNIIGLNKVIKPIIHSIPEPLTYKNRIRQMKRFVNVSNLNKDERYVNLLTTFDENEKDKIFIENRFGESNNLMIQEMNNCNSKDQLNKILYIDMKRYLPDDLLVKMDVATMANSLETRSPLLDNILTEFMFTVPTRLKLNGFNKKYILKRTLTGIIPKKIIHRKKQGFGIPLGSWFRNELKNYSHDLLTSNEFKKRYLFNNNEIINILDNHKRTDNGNKIWNMICLELWFREFIDRH